jgi:(1->4)-alpha-D-glucan 1-alpha-D-glucosylmutase
LQQAADTFAGGKEDRASWRNFVALIERQHYRLASWRIAADEINYRRFFDINDLAGIRMENPELFELTHRMIGRLVAQGALQGIRLDHIDGLYDPLDYLIRLYKYLGRFGAPADPRARGRNRFYILVEKILAADETLPQPWPVAGTTGYDFITELNGIFVNRTAEASFDRIYRDFTGETESFDDIVETAKQLVIGALLPSDLNRLTRRLKAIADRDWNTRDFSQNRLRQALTEVVAGFQVYRTYITARTTSAEDRRRIAQAVAQARTTWLWPDTEIFEFLEKALTGDLAREPGGTYRKSEVFAFLQAFQQYTGPVMAKSLEDTSFYRYYRLTSLNEVCNDPRQFGLSKAQFHAAAERRRENSPHSMLGSSTHDTKRGEDTRARINVLSEVPDEWAALLQELKAIAAPFKTDGMPSANDEYLIYQTILGIWSERAEEKEHLLERLQQYLTKALREAKVHSSWVAANEPYEKATLEFAAALYASRAFMDKIRPFARKMVKFGYLNGLSQTVLKLTVPGVSDIFQGSDLWNHSLADPDNRSKVDYELRRKMLAESPALPAMMADYTTPGQLEDGAIKLRLLQRLLRIRRGLPELFENGSYQPVEIKGTHAESLLAFTRRFGSKELLVVVGRLLAGVEALGTAPETYAWDWGDTVLDIPAHHWRDMLGARNIDGREGFAAGGLFGALPVGVWVNEV